MPRTPTRLCATCSKTTRESSEEANDFFKAHFDANPLGVEFDPEEWLTRLRAGAPESEFLLRQGHEPVSPLRGEMAGFLSGD